MINLLPFDGWATYDSHFIDANEGLRLLHLLSEKITWSNDVVKMFGRTHITKRQIAWYGDGDFDYAYSGSSRKAMTWIPELSHLKKIVEQETSMQFNSCLLNLYHNGDEGMGWHSDDEPVLGINPAIASISLGDERKFAFRHRQTKETIHLNLEHGSLLLMARETQHHWLHSLPKTKRSKAMRINLTFRKFIT